MRKRNIQSNNAFTLMEVMLVVAIVGIISAIAVPSMVKSIRGNRLRMAARSVITSGKYARSMAILQQRDVFLSIDMEKGLISVSAAGTTAISSDEEEEEVASEPEPMSDEERDLPSQPGGKIELERRLNQVYIESVETEGGRSSDSGIYRVRYQRSGRCTPYSVLLVDDHNDRISIEVDALASVQTEKR